MDDVLLHNIETKLEVRQSCGYAKKIQAQMTEELFATSNGQVYKT